MKPSFLVSFLLLTSIWLFAQESQQIKLYADKTQSTIVYSMNHPLHSWEGVCMEVNSIVLTDQKRDKIFQAAVSVKISSFDSQNANRDSHTMEVTEAIKYPNISFNSTDIKQDGNKLHVTGTLTFHGVAKTIIFDAVKNMENKKVVVSGKFEINMKDYNLDPPSLMAVPADKEIKLDFKIVY